MNKDRDHFDISKHRAGSEDEQSYNTSTRSKMLSAFQLTKNVYLPTMGSSLKQYTNEASASFKRYYNNTSSNPDLDYQTIGNGVNTNQLLHSNNNFDDLKITTYDAHTYFNSETQKYITEIKGNLCLSNSISRKNRWVYMGLKKLIIGSNKEEVLVDRDLELLDNIRTESQFQKIQQDIDEQPNCFETKVKDGNSSIFDARIYPFLNKGVADFPLVLKLNDIGLEHCLTKGNGDFHFFLETIEDISLDADNNKLSVTTNLKPQSVILSNSANGYNTASDFEKSFQDFSVAVNLIHYSQNHKVAVISDIDDTMKHTGVVESKKIILNTTFNKPIESWLLPCMANWYKLLKFKHNVDFFYVSNSPQQLFPSLKRYIDTYFPTGAIILKEYLQSNIFSNFLGSPATKKLDRILKAIDQYNYKKFILIGDSGESDLEAYIQACKLRPNNILAVYIRAIKGSISDYPDKEDKAISELNLLIEDKYYRNKSDGKELKETSAPVLPPRNSDISVVEDAASVSYKQISTIKTSNYKSSVLPPPPPPPRNTVNKNQTLQSEIKDKNNLKNQQESVYFEDFIDMDKKVEAWRYRIITSMIDLRNIQKNTDFKVQLKFFRDELIEESCSLIEKSNIQMKPSNTF
ncbi:hypothetical protein QEN19_004242 [Hanseniaspora menglaensis]